MGHEKRNFFRCCECFSDQDGQRIETYDISGAISSSDFGRHPALALSPTRPEAAVSADVEPVLQQTKHSQADVSARSGPDYQTFSSLASIKSCLSDSKTQITSFYPYYIVTHSRS